MKKNSQEELYIHLVDLRNFMLARDESTCCTKRELAARIVNGMITSLTFSAEKAHNNIAVLGVRDDGVSNEGCQSAFVCTAETYRCRVKCSWPREFSDGKGGLFKVNCPIWLQAPFEDGEIISDSVPKVLDEIVSKWRDRSITVVFITSKERAPDLDVFTDYMVKLVEGGFPRCHWGFVDVSEWKMFDPFKPEEANGD